MIKLENVSKTVRKKLVLSNIDLEINRGDFIYLTGHNGCGKTMLLRMLCGLIIPDTGTVVRDDNISYGVIIENPTFIMNESAEENLRYLAAINKKINDTQIDDCLKTFNLFEQRKNKVKSFSLGMKQRLAIAQAVMEEPDILLLDEPFNAIDDENLQIVYNFLNEYHEKGKTILAASHVDPGDKVQFSRKIVMNNGKISEDINF
ncbi:MAG: ATP-binding cassette domain-containing protein [Lachnospiraceae bacterium]|jgi:ABC-2 type transport system ATP-binding protein|nr:ATP-binding cassette domain-containing protein [Lachnospiraceae bacterium]MEE3461156.1 ATP-binding cassette domain-containing protein [Lachnospiraceae bacterium]